MTRSQRVVDSLSTLLKSIDGTGTYRTDVGGRVYKGRFFFDDSDTYPIITIEDGAEFNENVDSPIYNKVKVSKKISVHGLTKVADINNPSDSAHDLLGDIKQCIFSNDERLGGNAISVRYTGSSISAKEDSALMVSCTVDLAVTFADNLINPDD